MHFIVDVKSVSRRKHKKETGESSKIEHGSGRLVPLVLTQTIYPQESSVINNRSDDNKSPGFKTAVNQRKEERNAKSDGAREISCVPVIRQFLGGNDRKCDKTSRSNKKKTPGRNNGPFANNQERDKKESREKENGKMEDHISNSNTTAYPSVFLKVLQI